MHQEACHRPGKPYFAEDAAICINSRNTTMATGNQDGAVGAWPTEIRLHKDRRALTVAFDTGEAFTLPAEYLRVKSPSAEVQGHSPDERKTVPGKRYVQILEVQ